MVETILCYGGEPPLPALISLGCNTYLAAKDLSAQTELEGIGTAVKLNQPTRFRQLCGGLCVFVLGIFNTDLTRAEASCGIENCPAYRSVVRAQADYHLAVRAEFVDFALYGLEGQYIQYAPRFEYRGFESFSLGFQVPVTTLFLNDSVETGLSNPVVFGEWQWRPQAKLSVGVGLQLELPLGDSELGISDSHFEILPYVRSYFDFGLYFTAMQIGFRQSLDEFGHEGGGHTHVSLVYVNPHVAQEFTYRVHLGRQLGSERVRVAVYLDVVQELGEPIDFGPVIRAGLDGQFELSKVFDMRLRVDRGVSSYRRTEWRSDVSLQYRW